MDHTPIVFVKNLKEAKLLQNDKELLGSANLMAMTFEVIEEFSRAGMPFVTPWDLLDSNYVATVVEMARELSRTWYGSLGDRLKYKGVDLTEVEMPTWIFFFREAVFISLTIRTALQRLQCSEVITLSSSQDGGLESLCEGIVAKLAEMHGLPLKRISVTQSRRALTFKMPDINISQFAPVFLKQFYWKWHQLSPPTSWDQLQNVQKRARDGTVMVLGSYHSFLDLLLLAEELEKTTPFQVVRVHVPRGASEFRAIATSTVFPERKEICDILEKGIQYFSVLNKGGTKAISHELAASFALSWTCFKGDQALYTGPLIDILGNPHLDSFFSCLLKRAWFVSGRTVAQMHNLLDLVKPDILIVKDHSQSPERACIAVARVKGIPTLTVHQSGPAASDYFNFNTEYMTVSGEMDKESLVSLGKDPCKVIVTGNPKYDRLARIENDQLSSLAEKTRRTLGIPQPRKVVLILTNGVYGDFFSHANLVMHLRTLEKLFRVIRNMSDVLFIVKPHPRSDYTATYQRLIEKNSLARNCLLVGDKPLEEILAAADAVVLVDHTTTAAIFALWYRKPLIYIQTANLDDKEILETPLVKHEGALMVKDLSGIKGTFESILYEGALKEQVIQRGQDFLQRYSFNSDGGATGRVIKLIDQIVRRSRECAS